MKDKLIVLTCVILFGLLLSLVAPRVNAWAAVQGSNTVVCAPGALVSNLEDGGLKVTGQCKFVSAPEVSPDAELEPVQIQEVAYPYPVPEPLTTCEGICRALGLCSE